MICKLISQLQDIGTQTVSWQARAVATLRRICTSARGAVVEQSLVVVSRTVHCLTRTVTIALNGRYITTQQQHNALCYSPAPLLLPFPLFLPFSPLNCFNDCFDGPCILDSTLIITHIVMESKIQSPSYQL